jgi:hypothetical protein
MNTLALLAAAHLTIACPFCTAVKPTLAQQRDGADVVAIAEVDKIADDSSAILTFHQVLKGKALLAEHSGANVKLEFKPRPGALLICFGSRSDEQGLTWTAVGANETSLAYFAGSPDLRQPAAKRLRYFARYLEHADPLIAEDAYLEFGHAPYDVVVQTADALSMSKLREWLVSERVPEARKGFYGVALGAATGEADRQANLSLLKKLVSSGDTDFRVGFDGVLAGFLLLGGESALDTIDERFLSNPKAADGDVRHALAALRFYAESKPGASKPPIAKALRHVLKRPEFADRAIIDLARWQDWSDVREIAKLYSEGAEHRALRLAVVGYLRACPLAAALDELEELQKRDAAGVAAAIETLDQLGSAAH